MYPLDGQRSLVGWILLVTRSRGEEISRGSGCEKINKWGVGICVKKQCMGKGGGTRELHIERHMKYLIFKELLLN